METNTGKNKVVITGKGKAETNMNRIQLEEVRSLKYLKITLSKDGSSKTDICIRIASATAAIARLDRV